MSLPRIPAAPFPIHPTVSRASLLALLIALLTFLSIPPALAHSKLLSSQPKQGEKLAQPPRQIILQFSAPVEPTFSRIELRQQQWQALHITIQGKTLRADLPSLLPGQHQVRWSIMSADGHHQTGMLRFSIMP